MLHKLRYLSYADYLNWEVMQCEDEGKDIAGLKEEAEKIMALNSDNPLREKMSIEFLEKTALLKIKENFKYKEPSDLTQIKLLRPEVTPKVSSDIKREELYNKIYGAWLGRSAGCLLGQPVEGWSRDKICGLLNDTDNYPINRYISSDISQDIIDRYEILPGGMPKASGLMKNWINNVSCMPEDDDMNYTVLGLKLLMEKGKDFTSEDVGFEWLISLPIVHLSTAERVAYKNMTNNIFPPASAKHLNIYREWIGAQIRADLFGYINSGDPEMAAEMAWRDASVSHIKNGIYGEMFVAAMLAAAAVTDNVTTIIKTGLGQIPENCRLAEAVHDVLIWYKNDVDAEEVVERIHQKYDESNKYHWAHTIPNAQLVSIALLYGEKDFDTSLSLSVSCGFDTDCNGATLGSILGMILGADLIPDKWKLPLNDRIISAVTNFQDSKISELAKYTLDLIT